MSGTSGEGAVRGSRTRLGEASLGTRFAVTFALVAAVVIVLVGSLAYNAAATLVRNSAQQEFDSTVSGVAQTLSASAEGRSGFNELNLVHSKTFSFQVVDGNGDVMVPLGGGAASDALPVTDADRAAAAHRAAGLVNVRLDGSRGEPLRVATVSFGQGLGAVQIVQRLRPTEQLLDTLAWQMVMVGMVALAGAGLAGWLVARRVTGRLVRLTEAAEYVTSTGRLDRVTSTDGNGGKDEVGRLGNAFNAMLARLAASKEEQRRLVQNASHELRTPLTSLRTNVSVMKRFDRLSPDARRRLVDDLQGETRELTDLVNELVGLATETHEDEVAQEVALREVAERVAARGRRRTGREIVVDADGSVVEGRPSALERALSNPVENAAKFDPEGAAPIEISVRDGVVEIRDRGPGIDEAELAHVFERFYRATSARGLPGSGLGLSMVQDIAESHGGTVRARNREGGGAVIEIRLPVVRDPHG
ncbi:HAMP domain-containing sensor histidine kinase [Actinorugispora endophytica]|uniref:histidine kinase n=1 Tax=Actinorugispora endophytica TaxID=1605990 RepID=A0A4R6US98_9ACTN|nr:HAMP domain-containing sensor histidine kinase [Actinorugispora endophytica]TDQ49971.1 two-component system sensor histidine kinase MprB [Actinorugispora endophytica]